MCNVVATRPADEFAGNQLPDFETRFLNALNEGGMLLLCSLGYRSGLLSAMASGAGFTSSELAELAHLNERYVREWLGGMCAAGIVAHDPQTVTYRLPPEHAALLSETGDVNLAVYAQYLPLLGGIEDDVLHCFRHGGGVPYERYTRFHEVMAQDSAQTVLPALFDGILPLAAALTERLEAGIDVVDLGCGRGLAIMTMAERFPASRFTGYDLSHEAIAWARDRAAEQGLENIRFEARDLSDFDATAAVAAFDLALTFDAIHDQARPLNLLRGIRRTLRDEGVYLAQDIHSSSHHHKDADHPLGALFYAISTMHCMTVSLAQGGEGLGTMWGRERAREYFTRAGFGEIEVHQLPHDVQNDYWVLRP
ncbi:MAG TPA: class I SAM-dependent methyltransferase [Gammaproteobacteria bacterium]|nr:class I SAM-dependent methyltransferase [Gammaproteobacteria bacterium]